MCECGKCRVNLFVCVPTLSWGVCLFVSYTYEVQATSVLKYRSRAFATIGKQCNGKQPKHLFLQKDHLKDEILDEKRLSLPDHLRPLRTLMAEVRNCLDPQRWDSIFLQNLSSFKIGL